jgi:hypothetical protein
MSLPYDAPIGYDAAVGYDGPAEEIMTLRRMWDAAFPPASPPKWEVAAGYIGGNTPHVWTDAEWARQPARFRLPIFVRSHDGDPLADAHSAITWLVNHEVPRGVTLALDYETRVDATYLAAFDRAVMNAGWKVMVYGSRDFVLRNPKPSGGYWVADYTGSPHLYPGSAATQWSGSEPFGGAYDPNLVADSTPLWDTEGDLTVLDDATRTYLDSKFAAVQQGLLVVIRGDETTDPAKDTHPDNIQRTRQDLAAGLSAINTALTSGLNVNLDLSSATSEQLDQLAALVAGHIAVKGVSYQGTVQLDPKPVA